MLRLDDDVFVAETRCYGGILRHYAFSKHWFKINVSVDDQGRPVASGDGPEQFAFNCDIATPMERDGRCVFGVDLFIDVLVGADAVSLHVQDEEEFTEMAGCGLVSPLEAAGARAGLQKLLELVESRALLPWLSGIVPFGPCDPPVAPPMERAPVPTRMRPHTRSTW